MIKRKSMDCYTLDYSSPWQIILFQNSNLPSPRQMEEKIKRKRSEIRIKIQKILAVKNAIKIISRSTKSEIYQTKLESNIQNPKACAFYQNRFFICDCIAL